MGLFGRKAATNLRLGSKYVMRVTDSDTNLKKGDVVTLVRSIGLGNYEVRMTNGEEWVVHEGDLADPD